MLSILILSHKGEGYEIADRIRQDGHIAKFWIESPEAQAEAKHEGLLVNRYEEHIEAADLIIATSSRLGGLLEAVRKRGKAVVGGGICRLLDFNPDFALNVANLLGLTLEPPPEEGISLVLCGWFLGDRWSSTYMVQEYRRLLDHERGPTTNGMGWVCWPCSTLLDQLTSFLSGSGYKGFLGVRVEVINGGLYFNGFVTSLAGGILPALMEVTKGRLSDVLLNVAYGREVLTKSKLVGLSLKVLAYNNASLRITDPMRRHVWSHSEQDSLGYITSCGDNPREARRRANRTASNACTIDTIYRSDIGLNCIQEGMNYESKIGEEPNDACRYGEGYEPDHAAVPQDREDREGLTQECGQV